MDRSEELLKRILAFREARDWKQFHNPKDLAISLVLEATEVLEHFQWKNGDELREYLNEKKEALGDELADTLYWVLLISHDLNIDVMDALERKMEKNEKKYPVEKARGSHAKYNEL